MEESHPRKGWMRAHYDFRGGVRGKYAERYAEGTNVVVLAPDVAKMFPNGELVNEAHRAVGRVVQMRSDAWRGRTRALHATAAPEPFGDSGSVAFWPRRVSAERSA